MTAGTAGGRRPSSATELAAAEGLPTSDVPTPPPPATSLEPSAAAI